MIVPQEILHFCKTQRNRSEYKAGENTAVNGKDNAYKKPPPGGGTTAGGDTPPVLPQQHPGQFRNPVWELSCILAAYVVTNFRDLQLQHNVCIIK